MAVEACEIDKEVARLVTSFLDLSVLEHNMLLLQHKSLYIELFFLCGKAMPKNLNFCFTKFKSLQSSDEKSLQENYRRPFCNPVAASLPIKNFNSLYENNIDCSATTTAASVTSSTTSDYHSLSDRESEYETTNTADFATAFASQRFFFSSPGLSNSIVESTSVSSSLATTSSSSSGNPPESDSIAVPTYSADLFTDFRRSMQDIVEARELIDVNSDWDYLHELLMRYLSLNPKTTHKFIFEAFADLLVSMMKPPAPESGRQK
ncbi:transcription repressor OFP12-like [Olea europaea var. sylvestris]|uniref:transcription repressor OFP12-like n=1 Tax=Olea europaea var. sylvestris TaxID=158386 RepID=UPI000C1D04DB|nr:transcription repressor OFP12-like [Olea europaea var. sylvestris]